MWVDYVVSFFFLCLSFPTIEASVICGNLLCYGAGAYCCGGRCCTSIWTFWWFWIIWVFIFTCLGTCGWWCGRRYRERRYQRNAEYLIVHPANQTYVQPAGNYGAVQAPPYSAQAPPYTATEVKPPTYEETATRPPVYAPST